MPELPEIELYLACLRHHVQGSSFSEFRLYNPFVLRSLRPKPPEMVGEPIEKLSRMGKRIVFHFPGERWMVIHLMVSGRLRWFKPDAKAPFKISHASWRFEHGVLVVTEASTKKAAGIWLGEGPDALAALDPGGLDPLTCSLEEFSGALTAENRTLKRGLSNPHRFAGMGGAFSDEILHDARLSPLELTQTLEAPEIERLYQSVQSVLSGWTKKLIDESGNGQKFPGAGEVTAFRPDFAVHGKFGQPCPVCGKPVQRIVYADRETNYCAKCQTGGKVLADRAMSRLLKDDWPRTLADDE